MSTITSNAHLRSDAQRRTIRTLVAAQVTGGVGLASGITVAALIAVDLSGDTGSSGLPEAAAVAGTAAAAIPLAWLMQRRGRRPGLRTGWLVGAAGAVGVIVTATMHSLPLLIGCMVLLGCANASSDAARHAAADLARPAASGRAIGTVVAATAVGATLGPLLTGPMSQVASAAGLPPLTGPFILAVVAFTTAAIVVSVALRPDPLLVAGRGLPTTRIVTVPLAVLLRRSGVPLAIGATATANATMLALMAMTPIHLSAGSGDHAEHLGAIGLVVSLHLAAMFAPSPATGRLIDRLGARPVVAGGAMFLATAGLIAAVAGPADVVLVAVSLACLGLGWNACFVGGASLLAVAMEAADRPRIQGVADTIAGVAAVAAGGASGLVVGRFGYGALALLVAAGAGFLLVLAVPRTDDRERRKWPVRVGDPVWSPLQVKPDPP